MSSKKLNTKINKVNIILTNLDENKLAKILTLVEEEHIHFTFEKDYYGSDYFDICHFISTMLKSTNKIPKCYKKTIDDIYLRWAEDTDNDEVINQIANIEYFE